MIRSVIYQIYSPYLLVLIIGCPRMYKAGRSEGSEIIHLKEEIYIFSAEELLLKRTDFKHQHLRPNSFSIEVHLGKFGLGSRSSLK